MTTDQAEWAERYLAIAAQVQDGPLEGEALGELNAALQRIPNLDGHLGVEYRRLASDGVTIAVTIRPEHLQPWGVTNGGLYTTLGESAGSVASFLAAQGKGAVMGTNNDTHFLRPTTVGDVVVSTATPEHVGRTSHLWRIEHRNEQTGKLVALTHLKTTVLTLGS